MTTITQDAQRVAEQTGLPPKLWIANDYGKELANAQVGQESLNVYGQAQPITLGTTNDRFDSVAQAHWVRDKVRELLKHPERRSKGGDAIVASTDQRSADGDRSREQNEGAPLYAAYIPEADLLIEMANADDCWALLAEDLAELNVSIHEVVFDDGTQFRGAFEFPKRGKQVWDDIHNLRFHQSVENTRSLTPITDEAGLVRYRELDAEEVAQLHSRVDEIERAPHGGFDEYYSSSDDIPRGTHVAILIADYVHGDKFQAAHDMLSPVTLPADVSPGDTVAAGFQLTLLGLNAREPVLVVVDFENPDPNALVYAARLPGGGLAVGPSTDGIWEHVQAAGYDVYITSLDVHDLPTQARELFDIRDELEFDEAVIEAVETPVLARAYSIKPPTFNQANYDDRFGQIKTVLDDEIVDLLTRAAQLAKQLDRNVTVPLEIDGVKANPNVGNGIFDVRSRQLVIAPGSSSWRRKDGKEVRAFELAVRDGSAAEFFHQELEETTERPRSGATISIDVDALRKTVAELEHDASRSTARVAALDLTLGGNGRSSGSNGSLAGAPGGSTGLQ